MNRLNLGCGQTVRVGWINLDRFDGPGVDVVCNVGSERMPFPDGHFDYVLASHVLEHVIDFAAAWRDIYRVLKSGGILEVEVPYGPNADPFHLRAFDEGSLYWMTLPFEHRNLDRDSWWSVIDHEVIWGMKSQVEAWLGKGGRVPTLGRKTQYIIQRLFTLRHYAELLRLLMRPFRCPKFLWFRLRKDA